MVLPRYRSLHDRICHLAPRETKQPVVRSRLMGPGARPLAPFNGYRDVVFFQVSAHRGTQRKPELS